MTASKLDIAYNREKNVDVKERILLVRRIVENKKHIEDVAIELHRCRAWAYKWYKRYNENGRLFIRCIDIMKKNYSNSPSIIIRYCSRILFSTVIFAAIAISILVLLMPFSSFFVLAVDMPSSASPPPTTTEKPGGMSKTPSLEETKDPKDGDTILSSNPGDGTPTVATKVDKKSNTKTFDFNRGYVTGFALVFGFGFESENVDMSVDEFLKFRNNLENKYVDAPAEFKIGFNLDIINAVQFLKINKDVLSSGGQ